MKRILSAVMLLAPAICLAQSYGRHPFYLHARSDLRVAERLMSVCRQSAGSNPSD